MAITVRRFACTPDAVFDVFRRGWLYPTWVVGASRMRGVDDAWPAEGSQLHHSLGAWPFLIDDTTTCAEWDPPHRMTLTARIRPLGEARVEIETEPDRGGTTVRIRERFVTGPASMLPRAVTDPLLWWRNVETLKRLAFIAEGGGAR